MRLRIVARPSRGFIWLMSASAMGSPPGWWRFWIEISRPRSRRSSGGGIRVAGLRPGSRPIRRGCLRIAIGSGKDCLGNAGPNPSNIDRPINGVSKKETFLLLHLALGEGLWYPVHDTEFLRSRNGSRDSLYILE